MVQWIGKVVLEYLIIFDNERSNNLIMNSIENNLIQALDLYIKGEMERQILEPIMRDNGGSEDQM